MKNSDATRRAFARRIFGRTAALLLAFTLLFALLSCGEKPVEPADEGEVIAAGAPRVFFARNSFYAPAICRMTRGLIPGCLTVEEAAEYLKGKRER